MSSSDPSEEEDSSLDNQPQNMPLTPLPDPPSSDTKPRSIPATPEPWRIFRTRPGLIALVLLLIVSLITIGTARIILPALHRPLVVPSPSLTPRAISTPTPDFNPDIGAVLPTHRVVAYYAVPGAEATGPAYILNDSMLAALRRQGAAYEQLDPAHPVQLGIDLVVSVPDAYPGPNNYYSHHVDAPTIQAYIDFCSQHNLILFLDLNIGLAPIMSEVSFFLPYLEQYTFVHMAIDPEWMFPRHNGIPGINLSNVRASDLNPIIEAVAAIPMQYHVPRKILIIHQYRPDGDGLADPYDAGQAEIADKGDLVFDPRVDVVIHVDSVGGYFGDIQDKRSQYHAWVDQDMKKYGNFLYGGFKLFYQHEAKTHVMTPKEVLSLNPPPMVITYGN